MLSVTNIAMIDMGLYDGYDNLHDGSVLHFPLRIGNSWAPASPPHQSIRNSSRMELGHAGRTGRWERKKRSTL
jgi:hypothetical protein